MYIDKAVKKQKKQFKNFVLTMCFIFLALPIVLFLVGLNNNWFLVVYLAITELVILLAVFVKTNIEKLEFHCSNNKLTINQGILNRSYKMLCDKVVLVHTEGTKEEMSIIFITTVKFRNKKIRPVGKDFLKRHPYVGEKYLKLKKLNPEITYYYIMVKKGGLKKYLLLDTMYRNCVKAEFTEDSIENIKISRKQKELI
ncbi:hypothetical protein [Clostridium hydrogeniformans]|uniref:hypothetical protein n=1 Tax=Clostridium hydrogeniformans TaxID=349933 RepID=UPI00048A0585|nr:hypothetical protein [Clostridium hydrogeniformans]